MAKSLTDCIRDGTFPDSEELLNQDPTTDDLAALLGSIELSKDELKLEIQDASRAAAGDVDQWIAQARKIQDDIEQCKIEARRIVEEHERGVRLRAVVRDTKTKVQLLESEVAFTQALEHEIENVADITQALNRASQELSMNNPRLMAENLVSVDAAIDGISATQTRLLLVQLAHDLRETSRQDLIHTFSSRWNMTRDETSVTLSVPPDVNIQLTSIANSVRTSTDDILFALEKLQALPSAVGFLSRMVESFILSILSTKSAPYPSSVKQEVNALVVHRAGSERDVYMILTIFHSVIDFLHQTLPAPVQDSVMSKVLPNAVSFLISTWLNSALPHDLHQLDQIEVLQREVSRLNVALRGYAWMSSEALHEWIEQIPRNWLAQRRLASLDTVRRAFALAQGTSRPVERIERQTITVGDSGKSEPAEEDDWGANWDEEPQKVDTDMIKDSDDDDMSGWDFETHDEHSELDQKKQPAQEANIEEDEGEAWGWDDEETSKDAAQQPKSVSRLEAIQTNGRTSTSQDQEVVLKETYYITDIPDHILEIIGKDMADWHDLQTSTTNHFDTAAIATGLASVPNLTLALFRATAPTYYSLPSTKYVLSNINLYNDTLYIAQKLDENTNFRALGLSTESLIKFARQTYSAELEIQRTILNDLLDGAQGFERCTTFPNSQACTDAVTSTIDRIRKLHRDWSSILGESHLLQTIGSLLTMIFGKIIKDVEDMDDIAEAESKQLVTFCHQILSLEDLFVSRIPNLMPGQDPPSQPETSPSSQILMYVPNYLRFQYLQQILESSLVDIKYLWTEGEMSLDFGVDEVVDLIKALFAESQYRRDAIRAIKGASTS